MQLKRNRNKMDYLEQAKQWESKAIDADTFEGEQSRATLAIAFALVAIAEHLDITAQDIASRVELASEVTGLEFPDKLASIVLTNTDLLKVLNEQITDIGRSNMMLVEVDNELYKRIDNQNERLDELERKQEMDGLAAAKVVGALAGLSVKTEKQSKHLDEIDSVIRRLTNRVSDLEMPAPPRVGVWQRCGKCGGDGQGEGVEDDTFLKRCDVCDGSGMVEVYVDEGRDLKEARFIAANLERELKKPHADIERHQRQIALRDKQIDEAQFAAATLERKVENILQVINDTNLSGDEIRDAVEDLD